MTENQEIELPIIKTGMGFRSDPDYTLIFKNTESLDQWVKQVKGIHFAKNNNYLVDGNICVCQIEQPEPPAPTPKPVAASTFKPQSFTVNLAMGKQIK
jgi:hypothetical protein